MVGLPRGEADAPIPSPGEIAGLGPVGALPREGHVASSFGPGRGREEAVLRAREFHGISHLDRRAPGALLRRGGLNSIGILTGPGVGRSVMVDRRWCSRC